MRRYKCEKQKIKGFRKKSIWPSILLFFIFIIFCAFMVLAVVGIFSGYMISSKLGELTEDSNHLGQMMDDRLKEEEPLEAAAHVGEYLKEENDICVTDEDYKTLFHYGQGKLPDFADVGEFLVLGQYAVIPDDEFTVYENDDILYLPLRELLPIAFEIPIREKEEYDDEKWMNETIFYESYWKEIPVKAEGYHVYYKDSLTLQRKDMIYVIGVIAVVLVMMMIPITLLFINVISSIMMQKRMLKILYLDTVTGGRNWVYFVQQCEKILRRIRNAKNTYAMVNLHMDHYQDYCACYGNKAGEELLENITGYLQSKTGRGEAFARFAKADFGILLKCRPGEACEKRLRKMLAELTGIKLERRLNYHAGIYLIPGVENKGDNRFLQRRQMDIDQIYHYATAAGENLHGKEGQFIQIFNQQILNEQLWKRKVADTMEPALMNKEFQLYLQPKFSPATGKIVGAEALVRWISPTEGFITPGSFIPIFEENGFITKLDDYMISAVAKLQSEWKLQGKKAIPVSVNVSRANFTRPDLAEHICHLVDSYGADHAMIELEVTESAFFGDKDMLQKIIKELKLYGFHISMDDFGAGYSSLNSLKDLPIDVLKLDMEFFRGDRGEDTEHRREIVVRETIQLAKNLDMKIVAEGIERKEQVEFLAEQGCDMIQGFYYAKPMPVSEFDERVESE